eukprot:2654046-Prymnesium_polylepis.1
MQHQQYQFATSDMTPRGVETPRARLRVLAVCAACVRTVPGFEEFACVSARAPVRSGDPDTGYRAAPGEHLEQAPTRLR